MQDPNEDTEWNDVLRKKGIIPERPKEKEVTEEQIVEMLEKAVKEKTGVKEKEDMSLDELLELEDEEEEKVLEQYRRQRVAEIKSFQAQSKFGDVKEISGQDYVEEVNNAGGGVHVVIHLYKQGIPLCAVINQQLAQLAARFPTVKFLKSISSTCIPNYPDRNLPSIFVYFQGQMKTQLVGPTSFRGTNMKVEELEYLLGKTGAIATAIKEDPRPSVNDVMLSSLKNGRNDENSDDNDW